MKFLSWLVKLLPAVPVIVASACSAPDAPPTSLGSPRPLAFTAFPLNAQVGQLAMVHADGTGLHLLSITAAAPAFSPDGQRVVAFADGLQSLEVMSADGSNRHVIVNWRVVWAPAWSPDGSLIAFMCSDSIPGYAPNICVVNANGGPFRRVTGRDIDAQSPSWSPDGTSIAFGCAPGPFTPTVPGDSAPPEPYTPSFARGICLASADGTGWRQIASGFDTQPQWSLATNQIAFVEDDTLLTIIAPDGSVVRTLPTPAFTSVSHPAWSPDGSQLAFIGSKLGGSGDVVLHLDFDSIYLINAAGGPLMRVTNGLDAEDPAWGP